MRLLGLLLATACVVACSRSALDIDVFGADGGPTSCPADAGVNVGTPARTSTFQQVGPIVIDPEDDLLLVIGGLSGNDDASKKISAVNLGSGAPVPLTRAGDATVALGNGGRAVWDARNHRVIVLGDSLSFWDPSQPPDMSQVFSLKIQGTEAVLAHLPVFPDGETGDIPLAAAIDPLGSRLLVIPEKGSVAGPVKTWALDLGSDSWSLFASDNQAALQNMQFVSATYDAPSNRLIAIGQGKMWTLPLDAPTAWTPIDGTFPPAMDEYSNVLGGGPSLVWDDDLCAYVVSFTDGFCLYQVWRVDIGASTFTATALGVSPQPEPRYGRGMAAFDVHRKNFVFGGAFDCEYEHDYVAASTDFVPVTP